MKGKLTPTLILFGVLISNIIWAQNIQPLIHQFVIRDANGNVKSLYPLRLNLTVYEGEKHDNLVYTEKHSTRSSITGMVKVQIGKGQSDFDFDQVIWKVKGDYFLQVEVDTNFTGTYVPYHESQILVVPQGIYAGTLKDLSDKYLKDINNYEAVALALENNRLILSNGQKIELPKFLGTNNSILISARKKDVTCHGLKDGSINLNIRGGKPPYNVEWSNGASGLNQKNLRGGIYTVYATDKDGYTAFKNIRVSEPDSMRIASRVQDVSNVGKSDGAIAIQISGGNRPYSYQWSSGHNSSRINNLKPGFYTVVARSKEKCGIQQTFIIREPIRILKRQIHNRCFNDMKGEIQIAIEGGKPPYQVLWSNGARNTHLKNLRSGKYYVSIKDSWGYHVVDSVSILQPKQIAIADNTTHIDKDHKKGSIVLNVSGGVAPYKYSWSTSENLSKLTNLNAGVYGVAVKDANGCVQLRTYLPVHGTLVDERDGQIYRTITVGKQEWMADNLNYGQIINVNEKPKKDNTAEKYCYDDKIQNCDLLGGLYTWEEAMQYSKSDRASEGTTQGVCPDGWHIPTDKEWKELSNTLGGSQISGDKLKDNQYWDQTGTQMVQLCGFSALPSGRIDIIGESYYAGNSTSYWSSTKGSSTKAWHRTISNRSEILYRNSSNTNYKFSVRCVKDK